MTLQKRINTKLFKQNPVHRRKKKIALSLLSELNYDFDRVEAGVDEMGYLVNSAIPEKKSELIDLIDFFDAVYYERDLSSNILESDIVKQDLDKLDEINEAAETIGIPVETIYPNYNQHFQLLQDATLYADVIDEEQGIYEIIRRQ